MPQLTKELKVSAILFHVRLETDNDDICYGGPGHESA